VGFGTKTVVKTCRLDFRWDGGEVVGKNFKFSVKTSVVLRGE